MAELAHRATVIRGYILGIYPPCPPSLTRIVDIRVQSTHLQQILILEVRWIFIDTALSGQSVSGIQFQSCRSCSGGITIADKEEKTEEVYPSNHFCEYCGVRLKNLCHLSHILRTKEEYPCTSWAMPEQHC